MKKSILLLIFAFVFLIAIPVAGASRSVTTDKTSALPGETVLISGTAGANDSVVIKIVDEAGNIMFFSAAKADGSGKYSAAFVVPSNMATGKLTITAGSGSDVATTSVTVSSPPATPTPTPTAKPTAAPTAKPTESPSPSASATPSASETPSATPSSSDEDEPVSTDATEPSEAQTDAGEETAVTPKEISQDEETGVITVVIDVTDLPEDTVAVEAPSGEILYVSDAQDGMLVIEVSEDDLNPVGDIEIVTLGDEMTPLATVYVHVLDEDNEIAIANNGKKSSGGWVIAVCIAASIIVMGAIVWILIRRKNMQEQND